MLCLNSMKFELWNIFSILGLDYYSPLASEYFVAPSCQGWHAVLLPHAVPRAWLILPCSQHGVCNTSATANCRANSREDLLGRGFFLLVWFFFWAKCRIYKNYFVYNWPASLWGMIECMWHLFVFKLVRCALICRLGEIAEIASAWLLHWVSWGWKRSAKLLGVQFPEKKLVAHSASNSKKTWFWFYSFLFSSNLSSAFEKHL